MKTLKKLFSVSAIVALLGTLAPMYAFGATYSDELQDAYKYAYAHEVTTMTSIDNANMYGNLKRIEMAKMLANYAINVLGATPDTTKSCTFPDVPAALDAQYGNGVTKACQLGLMGVGIENFNPNGTVTRAEFGTAFSRALNHDSEDLAEMNAATPYYKKHLEFLKSEGIMNQIDNPNQTEVRGYVMLMMMRADDSYSPSTVEGCTAEELLKCITADDYDACIAACSNGEEPEPDVTKKGTLNVSVKGNNGAKAIIDGISELDTIKLSASETINVEKVVLERYGYTKNEGVKVWLENTDGVIISNEKNLSNSKDDITLTIKKDYRDATEYKDYVIVTEITSGEGGHCSDTSLTTEAACLADGACETSTGVAVAEATTENSCLATAGNVWTPDNTWTAGTVNHTAGETIGFKVTDITSSAEKLNISSYTPTEYQLAVYNSSDVEVVLKGKDTKYNYEAGETYQVAKLRVNAGNAEISVNGFTLRKGTSTLDFSKYVDEVIVLGDDGKALRLSTSEIKKDSIKVAFPAQTVAAKKNADFTVAFKLKDFDNYGAIVALTMNATDLQAIETKTSTRVKATIDLGTGPYAYTFQGGKIKLSNTNLGSVSATQGANDVVIAEGSIELNEAVEFNAFAVEFDKEGVETLELWLDGSVVEEATRATDKVTFNFPTTLIEKSGKLQFVVDMEDEISTGTTEISVDNVSTETSFKKEALVDANGNIGTYDESGEGVASGNMAGSISFSKIKIQAAKGALENNLTKKVEVITDGSTVRKTVFDGKYTARKGDVALNEVNIASVGTDNLVADEAITFYLSIDGEEVASIDINNTTTLPFNETFGDISVKDGKDVTVKVEAEITANTTGSLTYNVQLVGENEDGLEAGTADADTIEISKVDAGTVSIIASNNNDVLLQSSNVTLAKFTVKSEIEGTKLTSFELAGLIGDVNTTKLDPSKVRVTVDGDVLTLNEEFTFDKDAGDLATIADEISYDVDSDGIVVEVSYRGLIEPDDYLVSLATVNGNSSTRTFNKKVVPALVKVTKEKNLGDSTRFTFSVQKYDQAMDITGVTLEGEFIGAISNGETEELNNNSIAAQFIETVEYYVDGELYTIEKDDFKDYFRTIDESTNESIFLKIFKVKD